MKVNQHIIVMGVSGSGKSTVGKSLAGKLNIPFYDADDFHPESNILKMQRGEALTDEDRDPWLQKLVDLLALSDRPVVLACSALKRAYREKLRSGTYDVHFIYLAIPRQEIEARMRNRQNHFFPATLLDSQFATLEIPYDDERDVTTVQGIDSPELISILQRYALHLLQID